MVERTAISFDADHKITYTEADGTPAYLAAETPVSMNLWGFTPDYFEYSAREFNKFLAKYGDQPKSEFSSPR